MAKDILDFGEVYIHSYGQSFMRVDGLFLFNFNTSEYFLACVACSWMSGGYTIAWGMALVLDLYFSSPLEAHIASRPSQALGYSNTYYNHQFI